MIAASEQRLAEQFVEAFEEAALAARVPVSCGVCGKVVAHVHPPAPPVPLICAECREVTV